tara:strand:- start:53 stop:163 length:111 start_codon:yes stop_codon:yes gene_type:complete
MFHIDNILLKNKMKAKNTNAKIIQATSLESSFILKR